MTTSYNAFEQFRRFLKDMFQFEDNDLDFGIYRITRLKRRFIEAFIDGEDEHSLRSTVGRILSELRHSQSAAASNFLSAFAASLGPRGQSKWDDLLASPDCQNAQADFRALLALADPNERQQAEAQLEAFLENRQFSSEQLETQVYNHLLNFFELYYQNGDFGYNTRAASAFKVPYEADYDGADILFHWKHKDSYYIKTGNGFHNVRCQIQNQWLEFRLSSGGDDAAESSERNNNKDTSIKYYRLAAIEPVEDTDANGQQRTIWQIRFTLATQENATSKVELYQRLWETIFSSSADLTPYLHRRPGRNEPEPGRPAFADLGDDYDNAQGGQVRGIGQLRISLDKYLEELAKREEFRDLGRNQEQRQQALAQDATALALWELDRQLNKFYVGNDADYFIHKDLQGFLTREKSRFIKQVIFSDLDALLHAGEDNATTLIARAFNQVADTLIGFLAAIEEFQKALFELKKKVVDTHYLVSVGKIPHNLHARVFANAAQRREWQDVFKVMVNSAEELAEHPTLVVDTSLFRDTDPDFQDDLLSQPEFDDLDEQIDGLLINSENWQALNLLQEKFRERIKCIYIDPPYNTGGDGFLYKDSFRHSSWASMIYDRLEVAHQFLSKSGVLFSSIDDKERTQLEVLLKRVFGESNRVEEIIWAQNTNKNRSPTYSTNHEYVQVYAKDIETAKSEPTMFREPKPGHAEIMELVDELNPGYPTIEEIEKKISALFSKHRRDLKEQLEAQGIEFNRTLDAWRGLYNYRNAEYRDTKGKYVSESEARAKQARIWIWREDNPSMPQVKQDSQKLEFRDPDNPAFRFYRPSHPKTGAACPHPKRGWAWPLERMEGQTSCFTELAEDNRIAWGDDERKIPQIKRYLHEIDTNVGKSVVQDYSDGEKDLTATTGRTRTFASPKPISLIKLFVHQTTAAGEWVMDFFAGSGTTGHAVISSENQRRFFLVEMGEYFDDILKPRIKRVLYTTHWKDGSPENPGYHQRLVKVQAFEQYEDLLDNLTPVWDEAALPKQVPVRYLFRPEQNKLSSSLDLSRPFSQTLRIGRAREEKTIDLMETWCYLQGHWIKSRRVYREFDRLYLAVETTHSTLVVFRDIDPGEDDTANLQAILADYADDQGVSRIQRLELNLDADLRRLELDTYLIQAADFLRGTQWN